MRPTTQHKLMVVIAGPTAVGKTATAISLAQHYSCPILSADSRQFYRGLRIGTAAPTEEELAAAPHYFIGHLPIEAYYNVSKYEQEALNLSEHLFREHDTLIVVGGSGLYINALCYGLDELPDADEALRARLNEQYSDKGLPWLQQEVKKHDPDYWEVVDRQNPKRLLRALEVCLATGREYSKQRTATVKPRPFAMAKLALNLPREELFERINRRSEQMIAQGLIEEAGSFYHRRHLNSLNTVGYKEIFRYLEGSISLEQALADIKTHTRRYAKQQIRWFKKDPDFAWFAPGETEKIKAYIESKREGQ